MRNKIKQLLAALTKEQVREHNPSKGDPVRVLVVRYDRRTQDNTDYGVENIVSAGKSLWVRDSFNATGRAQLRGTAVKRLSIGEAEALASLQDRYEPALSEIKAQIRALTNQRAELLRQQAEEIEELFDLTIKL